MPQAADFDLASTFVVVGPDQSAIPVAVTPSIFEKLAELRNLAGPLQPQDPLRRPLP